MAHEIAKLLLEKADTFLARMDAIKAALELGMPFHEIEQYLDWVDLVRGGITPPNHRAPSPTTDPTMPPESEC